MAAGGVGGAYLGAAITQRIDNKGVENLLKLLILIVLAVCLFNTVRFIRLI